VLELVKEMEMACAEVLNVCLTERRLHFYPLDESAKLRSVHRGLAKECDIDILETRCIDSGHKAVQVLASSSIFEAGESRENNAFPWRWRQAKVVSAGGKERKWSESDRSWVIPDKAFANASGEKYPALGISWS
jgi:hypothetical protein